MWRTMAKTEAEKVRDLLNQAARQRRIASGATGARWAIDAGKKPVMRRGLFGIQRGEKFAPVDFGPDEIAALHDALYIVERRAKERAIELEQMVTTKGDGR
jgi:hypothetical protein